MLFFPLHKEHRPNRLDFTEVQKDTEYHRRYARWVLSNGLTDLQRRFIDNYHTNQNFYANKQWEFKEDLEGFLMDENGNDRHRLKVTRNFIQPMVEQYRGTASKMSFDRKVTPISPQAHSRMMTQLAKLLAYDYAGNVAPSFRGYLKKNNFPVTGDQSLTEEKFYNGYKDRYVTALNRIVTNISSNNKLDEKKTVLAQDIALSGIGVMEPYIHGSDYRFQRIRPDRFGWDRSAVEYDLSDSVYFFQFLELDTSQIFERWQNIEQEDRRRLESLLSSNYDYIHRSIAQQEVYGTLGRNKIPIYKCVWKDIIRDTFGYVLDEAGQAVLRRINYIEAGDTAPRYTIRDVAPYNQLNKHQQMVLKYSGKPTADLFVDNWRYAYVIPHELLTVRFNNSGVNKTMVLDYGSIPYQEPEPENATNMKTPYKVGMWSYVAGEVLSPVDVAINPQRMINRFLSVMEQKLSTAGGEGAVYDKDFVDGDEGEFVGKMMRGEAVGVRAKGRGVQNVVGSYSGQSDRGLAVLNNLVENYRVGIEQTTLVNEGLKGQSGGPDQLVGVMQLMIQRGSVAQEPFYKALGDIYQGCAEAAISSGRRFYIDNPAHLSNIVGEDLVEEVQISDTFRNEAVGVKVIRNVEPETEKAYVDTILTQWMQLGIVDRDFYARYLGRSTMDEITVALRDFYKDVTEKTRMAEQQNAAMQVQAQQADEQAGRVLYGEKIREEAREDSNKAQDRAVKMATSAMKTGQA